MYVRQLKLMLFLFLGTFMLAGCNSNKVQGEKEPDEIHNAFLMYEEKYTDEDDQSIGDLYLISEGKEKEKIASRVLDGNYSYINSQNKVLFINDENELYEYDREKGKTKLAKDVVAFNGDYSKDIVTYQNADNDLYIINEKNQEDKVSSTVTQYALIGEDIYYLDDDGDFTMYNIKDKQETEIDSDVFYFKSLSDEHEVAYLDEDYSLYYKKDKDQRIKITSDEVSPESLTKIGSSLVYYNVEDESNELTISPLKEGSTAKKIAGEVRDYQFDNGYYYYVNTDDNLFRKKDDEENTTKLASDVSMFKLAKGTVIYTDKDNKLFKLKNDKDPEKVASSVIDFEVSPKGDIVYKTDDLDLYVNNKKIASGIKLFHQYFGNLAYAGDDDKLYLMEDMGDKKIIEDDLDQFSNGYYHNAVIYSNELTFADISGVWKAEDEGDTVFLEVDKTGQITHLLTGESEQLTVDYAGYHSLHASSGETNITFILGEDHSLTMNSGDDGATLTKSTKSAAEEYYKNVQMEADKMDVSRLMDSYITNFPYAVNQGDAYYIQDYLDLGSPIYKEQADFVQKTYEKNIKEELVEYEIESITSSEEGVYTVVCTETFSIYNNGDYEGTTKTFKNTYTVRKISGDFQITNLKVSQSNTDSL